MCATILNSKIILKLNENNKIKKPVETIINVIYFPCPPLSWFSWADNPLPNKRPCLLDDSVGCLQMEYPHSLASNRYNPQLSSPLHCISVPSSSRHPLPRHGPYLPESQVSYLITVLLHSLSVPPVLFPVPLLSSSLYSMP